jgi:2-polyprenyl-6-methoxyphenol hydroxylase-like FAD-dependent oxidoreductase
VTLLGDAHLTPPDGEGANLAMQDGAELGNAIAAHPDDIETALTEYEQTLFPRIAAAAARAETEAANKPTAEDVINFFSRDAQTV